MTTQVVTTEYGSSYLRCDCTRSAIRHRTLTNGTKIYALQCLDCGRQIKAVSKNAPVILEMPNRVPFDTQLQEAWQEKCRAHSDAILRARDDEKQQQDAEWWRRYDAYLRTPAWQRKRAAVMARANGMCEGCATKYATQVHHQTYAHVGHELLFELVAVCDACHHILHPEMD